MRRKRLISTNCEQWTLVRVNQHPKTRFEELESVPRTRRTSVSDGVVAAALLGAVQRCDDRYAARLGDRMQPHLRHKKVRIAI